MGQHRFNKSDQRKIFLKKIDAKGIY
jgi:hypothetical protein